MSAVRQNCSACAYVLSTCGQPCLWGPEGRKPNTCKQLSDIPAVLLSALGVHCCSLLHALSGNPGAQWLMLPSQECKKAGSLQLETGPLALKGGLWRSCHWQEAACFSGVFQMNFQFAGKCKTLRQACAKMSFHWEVYWDQLDKVCSELWCLSL